VSPAAPTCLIRNIGTLVTGDRTRPLRRADLIFIEDGRIREIGLGLSRTAGPVIDARGTTAIPGLIDSHSHPTFGDFSLVDYRLPLFSDLPETFEALIVEGGGGPGPHGAKGVAEGAIIPVAPAIAKRGRGRHRCPHPRPAAHPRAGLARPPRHCPGPRLRRLVVVTIAAAAPVPARAGPPAREPEEAPMIVRFRIVAIVAGIALALTALASPPPAAGQSPRSGGLLNVMQREDLPQGFAIHETSTISTVWPSMPCFNNLALVPHQSIYNYGRMQEVWLYK